MIKNLSYKEKKELARSENTAPEILEELSEDTDVDILKLVAGNRKTPPNVLAKLANINNPKIRACVGWNKSAPSDILIKLADDVEPMVKAAVGGNIKTPPEVLAKLADYNGIGDIYVKRTVGENISTPSYVLVKLAGDSRKYVRFGIIGNPNTPLDILLKIILYDKEKDLREKATKIIKYRCEKYAKQ